MFRYLLGLLIILHLTACDYANRRFIQDSIVFERDTRLPNIGFKPTPEEIQKAESAFFDFLDAKTSNNETIYETHLDEQVPLQEMLRYYKRRYFGLMSVIGEKVIKIEFVFVRCSGQGEWKNIEYTNEQTKDCWWSVQYSIDSEQIYELKLQ